MNDLAVNLAAACRLLALIVVIFFSVKHRDWLGISIGILWAAALFANTFFDNRTLSTIFSTPLVYLVAWGIIKRQRGSK